MKTILFSVLLVVSSSAFADLRWVETTLEGIGIEIKGNKITTTTGALQHPCGGQLLKAFNE